MESAKALEELFVQILVVYKEILQSNTVVEAPLDLPHISAPVKVDHVGTTTLVFIGYFPTFTVKRVLQFKFHNLCTIYKT